MSTFRAHVLSLVRRIPPGRVATYGDVAAAAGHPRAARAVGNIMRTCDVAGVPCHRVVAAAGRLGGYGGYAGLKRDLLRAEGILFRGATLRDFTVRRYLFRTSPANSRAAADKRAHDRSRRARNSAKHTGRHLR